MQPRNSYKETNLNQFQPKSDIKIPFKPQDYQLDSLLDPARFKVIIRGRRGGKTEEQLQGAIKDAVTNPGLHWIVGPSYKQIKSIAWERLKVILRVDVYWKFNEQELYAEHPLIKSSDGRATRIELKGCDKEDSLTGVGLRSLRIDEAALIKNGVWQTILRPMLADHEAPATFYSTPRGKNWLYDLFLLGQGNDPLWKSWRQPTAINKYIKASEIEQMKVDMSDRLFRQEVLAEFLEDETSVFKGIMKCACGEFKEPQDGRFYCIGADLAKHHDFTVLTVMDAVRREVVAIERFQDIQWPKIKERIQYLARKYNNAYVLLDSTGVGDPILDDLQSAGLSVEGYRFTQDSKAKLIEQLTVAIEQRLITYPNYEHLLTELSEFEYSISRKGGLIHYSAPEGKYDDCVISLALAVWAIRSYIHSAQIIERREDEEEPVDKQGHGELVNTDLQSSVVQWWGQ